MLFNPREKAITMEYDGRIITIEPGKRYECDAAQEAFLYDQYRAYGIVQYTLDEWDDPVIKASKQIAGVKEAVAQAQAKLKSHELRNQAEEAAQKFKNSVTPQHITDTLQDIQDIKKELKEMEDSLVKVRKAIKDKNKDESKEEKKDEKKEGGAAGEGAQG